MSKLYGFEKAIREGRTIKEVDKLKKQYEEVYKNLSKEEKMEYKKKFGISI